MAQDVYDLAGQRVGAARGDQYVGWQDFGNSAGSGGDDGTTERQRIQDDAAEPLRLRRHHENRRLGDQRLHAVDVADEMYPVPKLESRNLVAERSAQRTLARDDPMQRGLELVRVARGSHERALVLMVHER